MNETLLSLALESDPLSGGNLWCSKSSNSSLVKVSHLVAKMTFNGKFVLIGIQQHKIISPIRRKKKKRVVKTHRSNHISV